MERQKNKLELYGISFFYIIYFVGIAGHLLSFTKDLMISLTPFTLFLSSIILVWYLIREKNNKLLIWFTVTYLITFLLEVIGVKTGLVFGSYNYGDVLGIKVFQTPLIIGLNWVFVIFGAYLLAIEIGVKKYLLSVVTGILAVAFDYFMEPVAIKLDYWNWADVLIPIQNYAAWFVIAFLFSSALNFINITAKSKIYVHYFVIQFLFFVVLNSVMK